MRLVDLMEGLTCKVIQGDVNIEIAGIEYDSRRIEPGCLFVCMPGSKTDGHLYVNSAAERGAVAYLVEKPVEVPDNQTVIEVENTRAILPELAARFYGRPSRQLRVIGVTGTNGKTTTTHLIKAILEEAGHRVGLIGTLYASWNGRQETIANTTPESLDIERFMRRVVDEGGDYVVMEVSSHALDIGRVREIDFNVGVFTNLTQDHLDYHQTFARYLEAKSRLFKGIEVREGNFAVVNVDDDSWTELLRDVRIPIVTYGIDRHAAILAEEAEITAAGSRFTVRYPDGILKIRLRLAGLFNVYNALASIAFAVQEGVPADKIETALAKVKGVPGRFESVDEGQDFAVIVDYAHTPDGLENVLKTARAIVEHRLITVFGCGGDRDRGKRPIMGRIAASLSDFCIVTSDNPRSEEPMDIINEILEGVRQVEGAHYAVVPDRRDAIFHAIQLAGKGDLVMIAGKGHEDYQIIKGQVLPFDDRQVARECLREKIKNE